MILEHHDVRQLTHIHASDPGGNSVSVWLDDRPVDCCVFADVANGYVIRSVKRLGFKRYLLMETGRVEIRALKVSR